MTSLSVQYFNQQEARENECALILAGKFVAGAPSGFSPSSAKRISTTGVTPIDDDWSRPMLQKVMFKTEALLLTNGWFLNYTIKKAKKGYRVSGEVAKMIKEEYDEWLEIHLGCYGTVEK